MEAYLMKSTICLAVILIIYLIALEREKMHRFNRAYLLFGLLLSLVITFVPNGEVIEQVNTSSPLVINEISAVNVVSESTAMTQLESYSWFSWERLVLSIYGIGLIFMLSRFATNITQLISKVHRNTKIDFNGAQLVLLKEDTLPHTFLNYIYVNEDQYRNDEIDEKLLAHELAHVIQRHSWDVILVEVIKAIFWFNPILIYYKRVIQLNHEFLADEAVNQKYNQVSSYQHLLVDTCQNNNQVYLASNINFQLTKKRLKMMTKKSSRKRMYMLMASLVPMAITLVMLLGQPVIAQSSPDDLINRTEKSDVRMAEMMERFRAGKNIALPKSFSPNGDGINDIFISKNTPDDLEYYRVVVYDLDESIIFESYDINVGWNGKKNNTGDKLKSGTYEFVLTYEYEGGRQGSQDGEVRLSLDADNSVVKTERPIDKDELAKYKFMRGIGLRVPTSFSPNGDGKNEVLRVQTGGADDLKSYQLIIYNKHNEVVFRSDDVYEAWNGKIDNVKGAPKSGIYVYSLAYEDVDDLEFKKNGEVKLLLEPNEMIHAIEAGNLKKVKISDLDTIPPAPPAPPSPARAPNESGIVPPPPTAPDYSGSWNEVAEEMNTEKLTYYLDGVRTTEAVIEKMKADDIEKIDVVKEKDGKAVKVFSKKRKSKSNADNSNDDKTQKTLNESKQGHGLSFDNDGVTRYQGKSIRKHAEEGAEVYLNGELLFQEVAVTICEGNNFDSIKVTDCDDGAIKIEIEEN